MDKQKILDTCNRLSKNTLMQTLQIEFVDVTEDSLTAKMPVNSSVHQPYGILHGGATAALAETVGSCASAIFIDNETKIIKGIELSINHLKSVKEGFVYGVAKQIHKGKTIHLWEIKVFDDEQQLISICKLTNIVLDKK
ncbi:thioesterase [Polaribacter gangjinensis]|uniref:Thioesterase n=2 Tax=Polaribacter gangjinensis TaxID=574710 RepID=A0A2S7WAI4_9FLAO|nr:thioesterase [Polaribacter gangjinensis]